MSLIVSNEHNVELVDGPEDGKKLMLPDELMVLQIPSCSNEYMVYIRRWQLDLKMYFTGYVD